MLNKKEGKRKMNRKNPLNVQVRLTDDILEDIENGMRVSGITTKSDFIRLCIKEYVLNHKSQIDELKKR